MVREIINQLGKIAISDEVIATMAGAATVECPGVAGMAARRVTDGITELLVGENLARGVEVNIKGDEVSIGLFVTITYGVRIGELAKVIVEHVRETVEKYSGLKVSKVRVNIQGIKIDSYKPPAELADNN